MITRLLIALALCAAAALGTGAGLLLSQVREPDAGRQDARSITGVSSGVDGTTEKLPEKKGVDQVSIPPQPPANTDPASAANASSDSSQGQTVDIQGVEGSDGITTDTETTIEIYTANEDVMQSIRGIQGIDTVMLQNLEAVLRMQAPPPPPEEGGGGGGRAAAALLTMENEEPPEPQEEVDGRQELTELELEGS